MKIKEILIYNAEGVMRRISFKTDGLNIITGSASTGKSALSDIIEYCMGRSSFNVPEGIIRDKVSWYAVIYQFPGEQVLVAKPAPSASASSCSTAMIRRGSDIEPPEFDSLKCNTDDDSVVGLLSSLLGIPENKTSVPMEQSREAHSANIKHTYFYLFQIQELIASKNQLFYRQNEPFMPQAIRDTLPILLGVVPDDQYELETKLRAARRELKLMNKQLSEAIDFSDQFNERAIGLLSEARQVGIISAKGDLISTKDILEYLKFALAWKPAPTPDEDVERIVELEDEIAKIRKEKSSVAEQIRLCSHY